MRGQERTHISSFSESSYRNIRWCVVKWIVPFNVVPALLHSTSSTYTRGEQSHSNFSDSQHMLIMYVRTFATRMASMYRKERKELQWERRGKNGLGCQMRDSDCAKRDAASCRHSTRGGRLFPRCTRSAGPRAHELELDNPSRCSSRTLADVLDEM